MKLGEFLKYLGRTVVECARLAGTYTEERIERHSEPVEGGAYRPRTLDLDLGGDKPVAIDRYALSNHKGMDLDEIRFDFETSVDLRGAAPDDGDTLEPTEIELHMRTGLLRRSTVIKVGCVFKTTDAPEAAHIVVDRMNENLREQLSQTRRRG